MLFKGCSPDFTVQDKPQLLFQVPSAFRPFRGLHQILFSESDVNRNKIISESNSAKYRQKLLPGKNITSQERSGSIIDILYELSIIPMG